MKLIDMLIEGQYPLGIDLLVFLGQRVVLMTAYEIRLILRLTAFVAGGP